jgi:chromosome segregation ATPase
MVDEKYIKTAITIRRTYLKLINNLDLYKKRAEEVSKKLEETVTKLDNIQSDIDKKKNEKIKVNEQDIIAKLFKILDEIETEGKKLEEYINPINIEIEKLAKEEQELFRQIVEHHPNLTEDQIVNSVRDRLSKEGII